MDWIDIDEMQPEEGQECLTRMKHGTISGFYREDKKFGAYYWRDMEWWAHKWIPIESLPDGD